VCSDMGIWEDRLGGVYLSVSFRNLSPRWADVLGEEGGGGVRGAYGKGEGGAVHGTGGGDEVNSTDGAVGEAWGSVRHKSLFVHPLSMESPGTLVGQGAQREGVRAGRQLVRLRTALWGPGALGEAWGRGVG
jgi:hypothetical protein